jgi:hypothetical protein
MDHHDSVATDEANLGASTPTDRAAKPILLLSKRSELRSCRYSGRGRDPETSQAACQGGRRARHHADQADELT